MASNWDSVKGHSEGKEAGGRGTVPYALHVQAGCVVRALLFAHSFETWHPFPITPGHFEFFTTRVHNIHTYCNDPVITAMPRPPRLPSHWLLYVVCMPTLTHGYFSVTHVQYSKCESVLYFKKVVGFKTRRARVRARRH
jgi:hypothetical protein